MDEGYVEDIDAVSEPEDVIPQGKRLLESCTVLEPQERVIHREGEQPRSSIQQFVDIFHGKDPISAVDIVGTSSSYGENSEGRVQELTLGHYNADCSMLNENEMMETIFNDLHHENQPGDDIGPGSSRKYATNNEKFLATSIASENLRPSDGLVGQTLDQNANICPGPSTYDGNDAVLRNVLPTRGMRMKIISKSSGSGCPEYFVKNTLKGKGVIYRGPISTGAEIRGQNVVKDEAPHTTTCGSPVNVKEKSAVLSTEDTVRFDLAASRESVNDGVSLREWLKSGRHLLNLPKVDSLLIFKQILDVVCSFHSEEKILVDLRPSCFRLLPSRKVVYSGRISVPMEMENLKQMEVQRLQALKRPSELGRSPYFNFGAKHHKLSDNMNFRSIKSQVQLGYGRKPILIDNDTDLAGPGASCYELQCPSLADSKTQGLSSSFLLPTSAHQRAFSAVDQLEAKWYRSPEEVSGSTCTCSSNIYCLGVFLFELLSSFDSGEAHAAAMSDLRHRILPPNFLSENPKEAGFCLWLLHPRPSLRPKARDILQSEVVSGCQDSCADDKLSAFREDEGESELLLHFLMSTKEQKEKHASKLLEDLGCIQADIKELEKRQLLRKNTGLICSQEDFLHATERGFLYTGDSVSDRRDSRFLKNVTQLESAYLSVRSHVQAHGSDYLFRPDRDVLKSRESWYSDQPVDENQKPLDGVGELFDGLCKYARYSKLEVCGTVRPRDTTNSTNVICSLSFDRDEDYFAAAGISKKIKIFDFQALCDNSVDIHYPVVEMSNRSRLSCVCWNNYIRNYLASTDYDGIVKLWDASTGQGFLQFIEHDKRAWSLDFSQLDPTKLVSGGDDCSVKLWSINERNCLHTIRNIANVCCVQFSGHSSHLLAFGSADFKIYCYDLRNANAPWCILAGHEKAVSYVKFVDSETLASASTDNTLKLWDLNRTSSVGMSDNACRLTLGGHTNEKNFVGLSVADGYLACGSETNEVYTYYKSLPMPITSHKFGSIDPISGAETDIDNGQFVSSACWKGKSNMLVAANSSGCIKALRMV